MTSQMSSNYRVLLEVGAKCAPVEVIELVGLHCGAAGFGDHAPVERLILGGESVELGRIVRLRVKCNITDPRYLRGQGCNGGGPGNATAGKCVCRHVCKYTRAEL